MGRSGDVGVVYGLANAAFLFVAALGMAVSVLSQLTSLLWFPALKPLYRALMDITQAWWLSVVVCLQEKIFKVQSSFVEHHHPSRHSHPVNPDTLNPLRWAHEAMTSLPDTLPVP